MNMKTLRPLLTMAATMAMSTSCSLAQPDILPMLPSDSQHATSASIPLGDSWLKLMYHRDGDSCLLTVEADRDLFFHGHRLELQLCGKPYSTASGKAWQQPLTTISKPGTYQHRLSEQDFRKNGGPYDYSIHLTLRRTNGQEADSRQLRLTDHMPGPGWKTYYEKENREQLLKLQEAAAHCASMRLVLTYHDDAIHNSEVPLPLSPADIAELRRLIGRMRPVKTHLHEVIPYLHMELTLLDNQGKELRTMDPHDVVRENHVNPENAAFMCSYALSNEDATTWYSIIAGPAVKQAIKRAVEENKKQRNKRR